MSELINEQMPDITKRFKDERARAEFSAKKPSLAPPQETNPEPITDDDYKAFCEVLGKDILSVELLSQARAYITKNWNSIIRNLPTGGRCCLSAIPFTDDGRLLTVDQIIKGGYLRLLYISGSDKLTHHFSYYPAHYFELLPDFIRNNCTFDAPKIEKPTDLFTSQNKFLEDYTTAFNKLRQFFDLEPITAH
jgi:hypothetical protein